ncbi:MAG: hypothetical protein Q9182_001598 [Xanthomendoza sp. 2 TL-2023]
MSRPQDVDLDYNARQQLLSGRARAPSQAPKRRRPPFPRAEDESTSLAREFMPGPPDIGGREARSRGSLDQKPLILDAHPLSSQIKPPASQEKETRRRESSLADNPTSSNESSGPETPVDPTSDDENRNRDRRYVFIPQEGVEIPVTYDESRTPIYTKHSQHKPEAVPERGRMGVPKLDTSFPRAKSSHDVPVRLERERSPYRSTPQHKEPPLHGDYLLSPEVMTPKPKHHEAQAHTTKRPPMAPIQNQDERPAPDARPTTRPSVPRQGSPMAYPGKVAASGCMPTYKKYPTPRHVPFSPSHRDTLRLEPHILGSPRRSSAIPSSTLSAHGLPPDHHHRQSSVPPPRALPESTVAVPTPHDFAGQASLNAMLATTPLDRRQASPRNSPRSSPQVSPSSSPVPSPRTPPPEASNRKFGYIESVKTSGSNTRPSTPLHLPPQPKYLEGSDEDVREHRGSRPAMRLRQTSPLHTQSPTLRPGNLEQHRRSSSAIENRPRLTVDSARVQEAANTSKQPQLIIKSPATVRAASVGAPPARLPPCPRSIPVAGYNDWYSLYDCSDFKICPSCRKAVSEAGYGRHLTTAVTKSAEHRVQCIFSIPWIRMAYLLMVKKRRSDVNLLYYMADVAEETPPCPGKQPSLRDWYRIRDIDSDRSVPGFYACPYCVQSLETIFPVLKGVFHKTYHRGHSSVETTCSLRSDSSRFATFVHLLEETANEASECRRAPNTYRFVELARTKGAIPPCSTDDMHQGRSWHIIHKLPEFTACPECYEEVVWPAVLRGLPLASRFSRTPQAVGTAQESVSCQMYSAKMRKVFKEACEDDDFEYLRMVAMKRYKLERKLQGKIVEAQRMPKEEMEEMMAEIVDEWAKWD